MLCSDGEVEVEEEEEEVGGGHWKNETFGVVGEEHEIKNSKTRVDSIGEIRMQQQQQRESCFV